MRFLPLIGTLAFAMGVSNAARADKSIFRLKSCTLTARDDIQIDVFWSNPGAAGRSAEQNTATFCLFRNGPPPNRSSDIIQGIPGSVPLGDVVMNKETGSSTFILPLSESNVGKGQSGHLGAGWRFGHTWGDSGKEVPITIPNKASISATRKPGKSAALSINVNSATAAQLQMLPGIGPGKAQQIIAHRAGGKLRRGRDLLRVPGIGPRTYQRLKPHVKVRGRSSRPPRE